MIKIGRKDQFNISYGHHTPKLDLWSTLLECDVHNHTMMTIKSQLQRAYNVLEKISDSPFLDSEILLAHILKKTKEYLYSHSEKKLTDKQINKFNLYLSRRRRHEPVAYIIGYKEFYGLRFTVNRNVLIPRPETEILVEEVLDFLKLLRNSDASSVTQLDIHEKPVIVDVGTGSGCIPVAIAKHAADIQIFGVDSSKKALIIARQNAFINKFGKRIRFFRSNLLNSIKPVIEEYLPSHLIITANLPYLSEKTYNQTSMEIQNFEPKEALIAGKDGLIYYERLFKQIMELKNIPRITVFAEIDDSQAMDFKIMLKKIIPSSMRRKETFIKMKRDLKGLSRVITVNLC